MAARVLIVCEDPELVQRLSVPLQESGYRVESAASGPEALSRIDAAAPDVLILKAAMPVMDGFEVLKRLRAAPDRSAFPVVLLLGMPADAFPHRAISGPGELFSEGVAQLCVILPLLDDVAELVQAIGALLRDPPFPARPPFTMAHASLAAFVPPRSGPLRNAAARVLNNVRFRQARRSLFRLLPFPVLASDIRDVVYLNWAVPVASARPLLPAGLQLWERDGLTLLTVLTYRHGHFGPLAAGPLRRLLPSPLQSNWRLYLSQVHGRDVSEPTVLFLKNVMDSALYTAGTRLFSDALPTHLADRFAHSSDGSSYTTSIAPGHGSAPDLACQLSAGDGPDDEPHVPPPFDALLGDWRSALAFLCNQDLALAMVDGERAFGESRISLPIDLDLVRPLQLASLESDWLKPLTQGCPSFCFVVPEVRFRVLGERLITPPR